MSELRSMKRHLLTFGLLLALTLAASAQGVVEKVLQQVQAARGDSNSVFLAHPEWFDPVFFRAFSNIRRLEVDALCGTQGRVVRTNFIGAAQGGRVRVSVYIEGPRSQSQDITFCLSPSGKISDLIYGRGAKLLPLLQKLAQFEKRVTALAWAPDGKSVAAMSLGGQTVVYDAAGKLQRELARSSVEPEGLAYVGNDLVRVGRDGSVWNSARPDAPRRLGWKGITRCAFGGTRLALGDEGELQIYDIPTGKAGPRFPAPSGRMHFNAGADVLCVRASKSCVLFNPSTGQRQRKIEVYADVKASLFTPSGNLLISGLGLQEFQISDGKRVRDYHIGDPLWMEFSSDGKILMASIYKPYDREQQQTIVMEDPTQPKLARQIAGYSQTFLSGNRLLQLQPDPPLARIRSLQGEKLRSIPLPAQLKNVLGQPKPPCCAVNPAGTVLAVGLPDGTVRCYSLAP